MCLLMMCCVGREYLMTWYVKGRAFDDMVCKEEGI